MTIRESLVSKNGFISSYITCAERYECIKYDDFQEEYLLPVEHFLIALMTLE